MTTDINSVMTITNVGLRLYNKVQRGECGLDIAGVTVGDGWLADGEAIETLEALKHELSGVEASVTGMLTVGDGQTRFTISIDTATEDYYLREIAVWATDPDEGDIIYAACNFGDHADYIKSYGGTVVTEQVYDLYVATGRATEINVDIVSSAQVTRSEFDTHANNVTNPHGFGNKSVLDGITAALVEAWNNAVAASHSHRNGGVLSLVNLDRYYSWEAAADHVVARNNPHGVTKAQVGLGNVTNESKATMFESPQFTGTPTTTTPDGSHADQVVNVDFIKQNCIFGSYTGNVDGDDDGNGREINLGFMPDAVEIWRCDGSQYSTFLQYGYNSDIFNIWGGLALRNKPCRCVSTNHIVFEITDTGFKIYNRSFIGGHANPNTTAGLAGSIWMNELDVLYYFKAYRNADIRDIDEEEQSQS